MNQLIFKEFKGCGECELSSENCDCRKIDALVEITFKKAEKADDWGKIVTVFRKGERVKGRAVIKDNVVYCASAKSNITDYEDFVDLNNIDIKVIN